MRQSKRVLAFHRKFLFRRDLVYWLQKGYDTKSQWNMLVRIDLIVIFGNCKRSSLPCELKFRPYNFSSDITVLLCTEMSISMTFIKCKNLAYLNNLSHYSITMVCNASLLTNSTTSLLFSNSTNCPPKLCHRFLLKVYESR